MNRDIDNWLRLLAGTDHNFNKLLDWLACAPSLDKPLCGLILAGPPQTGKSLFANGLKPLWQKYEKLYAPAALMVYREEPPLPYVVAGRYPFARFITATNHPTTLIEEIQTSIDLEDIERRWFYLEHTEEAAEYLTAHKSHLKTWADQEIAATAEALNQSLSQWRKVQRAGNLWVEGTLGAMRHLVAKKESK